MGLPQSRHTEYRTDTELAAKFRFHVHSYCGGVGQLARSSPYIGKYTTLLLPAPGKDFSHTSALRTTREMWHADHRTRAHCYSSLLVGYGKILGWGFEWENISKVE
jgi:hypothetical protein